MLITILYSLWIAYTVFSLGTLFGFIGLAYWANWENARHMKKVREMITKDEEDDLLSPNQQPDTK